MGRHNAVVNQLTSERDAVQKQLDETSELVMTIQIDTSFSKAYKGSLIGGILLLHSNFYRSPFTGAQFCYFTGHMSDKRFDQR